jgi:acyl-homoserine lactone acylase PvdQ
MRRGTTVLAVLVLLLAALAGATSRHQVATASTATRPMALAGLQAAARVARDANGIAHIFAANDHDAALGAATRRAGAS